MMTKINNNNDEYQHLTLSMLYCDHHYPRLHGADYRIAMAGGNVNKPSQLDLAQSGQSSSSAGHLKIQI